MKRRIATTGAVATVIALAIATPAWAYWDVANVNTNLSASAGSLPTPAGTVAFAAGTGQATFSFPVVSTAVKPTSYTVKNPSGTTFCTLNLSSAGAAGSCPALTPVNGNYTAQASLGLWQSAIQTINVALPTVTVTAPTTSSTSLVFPIQFSAPVSGLTSSGITIGGTAGATTNVVANVDGTNWTVTVTGMTQTGTVTVAVNAGAALDGSNRPNQVSNTASFGYTHNALSAPNLIDASDSSAPGLAGGITDNITNVAVPTFNGTLPSTYNGQLITLYDNGVAVGVGTVVSGNWTITRTSAMTTQGLHSYTITATPTGGSASAPSPALAVTFDSVAPTPTFGTPVNTSGNIWRIPLTPGTVVNDLPPTVGNANVVGTGDIATNPVTNATLTVVLDAGLYYAQVTFSNANERGTVRYTQYDRAGNSTTIESANAGKKVN
jgi:hypothetical protein